MKSTCCSRKGMSWPGRSFALPFFYPTQFYCMSISPPELFLQLANGEWALSTHLSPRLSERQLCHFTCPPRSYSVTLQGILTGSLREKLLSVFTCFLHLASMQRITAASSQQGSTSDLPVLLSLGHFVPPEIAVAKTTRY